ncbi:hypothetical protein OCU04_005787 [Sclerotinia nivalis]|uniref:Uncharacterized protein n=1 Tax=Sclerotinia nivalis TaxID=352851 RepID=A0A9X0DJD1_9HELO|nr:hypothetical protein OCU04_005787 [Sclerotinia nivalis]
MTSYIKKQCESISRRVSQAAPLKASSEKKSSTKTPPFGTSNVDNMTQADQNSSSTRVSKKEALNHTSYEPAPSILKKAHTTSIEAQKFKRSQKEPSSSSAESTFVNTPFSKISSTSQSSNTLPNINKSNKNGPDEKYQINSHLLFENSFPGHTFISVHLQRLQHGIYSDVNLHTKHTLHVTFVALSFIFHPSTPAHRFESAVIDIKVKDKGGNLRFLKYAPHQAYGKISTESLKWNFQLGASLGITQGPAKATVNPSHSEEKSKVVGTMMKIQGSTRSTFHHSTRYPDTLLHFSLEENCQQESGLPREFTFVFLLERPSEKQYPPVHAFHSTSRIKRLENRISEKLRGLSERDEGGEECMEYGLVDLAGEKRKPSLFEKGAQRLDEDLEGIFGELEFEIGIEPKISNTLSLSSSLPITPHTETTKVAGEVGQKFPTEGTRDSVGKEEHEEAIVHGLYNFAKLGGTFEELVCLPGESVGSRVPELLGAGGGGK